MRNLYYASPSSIINAETNSDFAIHEIVTCESFRKLKSSCRILKKRGRWKKNESLMLHYLKRRKIFIKEEVTRIRKFCTRANYEWDLFISEQSVSHDRDILKIFLDVACAAYFLLTSFVPFSTTSERYSLLNQSHRFPRYTCDTRRSQRAHFLDADGI